MNVLIIITSAYAFVVDTIPGLLGFRVGLHGIFEFAKEIVFTIFGFVEAVTPVLSIAQMMRIQKH